jgi:hypothetical protein
MNVHGFHFQVQMMRQMDAYLGVEGEEMMHALLMRPNSVIVQLMQYGTDYTFLGSHCKHAALMLELRLAQNPKILVAGKPYFEGKCVCRQSRVSLFLLTEWRGLKLVIHSQ